MITLDNVKTFLQEKGFNWDGTFCSRDYLHRREALSFDQLRPQNQFTMLFDNKDHVAYFSIDSKTFVRWQYVGGEQYKRMEDYSIDWNKFIRKNTTKETIR